MVPEPKRTLVRKDDNALQLLLSRSGSFPYRIAERLVRKWAQPGDVLLDPFCGKGTALLAGQELGLQTLAADVAPEAALVTETKLHPPSVSRLLRYVNGFPEPPSVPHVIPEEVAGFFHPETLVHLLDIRAHLLEDLTARSTARRQLATATMATLMGILHGRARYCLSIPSSHSFAMSPTYVARYASEHDLAAPLRDVRECLSEKIRICFPQQAPVRHGGRVARASVLMLEKTFADYIGAVDLILTSPPYLNAQTYAKDNWLRLWLLGYPYKELLPQYIETGSPSKYRSVMREAMRQMFSMLRPGGRLVLVAGDVRIRGREVDGVTAIFRTGSELALLAEEAGLVVTSRQRQIVPRTARYLNSISHSTGHQRENLVERIITAQKPPK